MVHYPRFRAAAVQAAPVYLDTQATISKAVGLIREASRSGARLVVFPEVFVPGYPYWNWTMTPLQGSAWFKRLYGASILADGPEIEQLCSAARDCQIFVVMGINERDPISLGTLYNSLVFISDQGHVLGVHRKLVPTWAEKLTWAGGDGSSLRVYSTEIGRLGGLACGENTNTLARYTLLAQGENVHTANYIALPTAPVDYDMVEAIKVRAAAHSFEGKLFTVVACSSISPEMVDVLSHNDEARALLTRRHSAFSGIFGPDGRLVSEPLIDSEGIVYGEIDIGACVEPKQMHDITGHYNRFDIFQLHVNRQPVNRVVLHDPAPMSAWPDQLVEDE